MLQRATLTEKDSIPQVVHVPRPGLPHDRHAHSALPAMTAFGDLDGPVLDESSRPRTHSNPPGEGQRAARRHAFRGPELAAGRQAFVVYPLIEESETTAEAAEHTRKYAARSFPACPAAWLRAYARRTVADLDAFRCGVQDPGGHLGDRGGPRRAQRHASC